MQKILHESPCNMAYFLIQSFQRNQKIYAILHLHSCNNKYYHHGVDCPVQLYLQQGRVSDLGSEINLDSEISNAVEITPNYYVNKALVNWCLQKKYQCNLLQY